MRTPSLAPQWAVALAVRFCLLPGIVLLFAVIVVANVAPDIIASVALVVDDASEAVVLAVRFYLLPGIVLLFTVIVVANVAPDIIAVAASEAG